MAVQTQEELESKIAKLENWIASHQNGEDKVTAQDLARAELEVARLKNLKGDEGIHTQSDIIFPDATIHNGTMVNTPEHKGVPKQIISGGKDITKEAQEANAPEEEGSD